MRDRLIAAGVKHLREFGYEHVNATNIVTDLVYRMFFKKMLEGTKEDAVSNPSIIAACDRLIAEIEKAK